MSDTTYTLSNTGLCLKGCGILSHSFVIGRILCKKLFIAVMMPVYMDMYNIHVYALHNVSVHVYMFGVGGDIADL